MALVIDRYRNSSATSSKRSAEWLYNKLVEMIDIYQLEENSSNVEKSLAEVSSSKASKPVDANAAKAEKEQNKPEKTKPKVEKTKTGASNFLLLCSKRKLLVP